jgi:hypothetical protein
MGKILKEKADQLNKGRAEPKPELLQKKKF